jgi:thiamine-phosphate diphosphorylase
VTTPRLHAVTDDEVLADPGFADRARAMMIAHGPALALHLRGHGTRGAKLYELAESLVETSRDGGAVLVVNDRVDVALASGCGAQLGHRSIPVDVARTLLGPDRALGYSAHDAAEARSAGQAGADFVLLGTVWASSSHPGRPGAGIGLIDETVADLASRPDAPLVIAIGGVTPERAAEAVAAGAHGVAAIGGVWAAADPVAAAGWYLESMGVQT